VDAEKQLELLKVSSTENATTSSSTSKPKLGILNLETPAVSDNSHLELPPPDAPTGKLFPISKLIDLDKLKDSPMMVGQKISNNIKVQTDYTPQDIAEYIFWTGNEREVVDALNDFLKEGIVGKEDVIKFVADVKTELRLLGNRFDSVVTSRPREGPQMGNPNLIEFGSSDVGLREKRIHDSGVGVGHATKDEEADYDELVQTMNAMNMKLREDSLKEIIYRLAREVFSERFGEHSISRFVHFVEDATSSGHIPKDLEKQILDTMVSALVDTLFEKDMNRRKGDAAIAMQGNPLIDTSGVQSNLLSLGR